MDKGPILREDRQRTKTICARLKESREMRGKTAPELAEELGIPTALYVTYEEFELIPGLILPRVCDLLDISPNFYWTGAPD